jgi:hypothetical protein
LASREIVSDAFAARAPNQFPTLTLPWRKYAMFGALLLVTDDK